MSRIDEAHAGYEYLGEPTDDAEEFDMDELIAHAAKGALSDCELSGLNWETLPIDLAEAALCSMVASLLVLGHRHATVAGLAMRLGILDEDGNWT